MEEVAAPVEEVEEEAPVAEEVVEEEEEVVAAVVEEEEAAEVVEPAEPVSHNMHLLDRYNTSNCSVLESHTIFFQAV